jgi:hypothetical protein
MGKGIKEKSPAEKIETALKFLSSLPKTPVLDLYPVKGILDSLKNILEGKENGER